GQATGIGFPGEAVGVLPSPPRWRPVEEATLSYGYGLSVNALQLAQAYMVIANGGIRYPVSLLRQDAPPAGERVLSEKVSYQVREMLREVVENGTGKRAKDRKSTRLNSSHVKISYAVFCLKKKRKEEKDRM